MSDSTNVRVLVAEDEEHLGAILEHFLRGRGYEVTMCRDGKAALEAVQRGTYDVALIDIVMPEMDGLDVLRHLQTEPDSPEVIIITGNGTIDTAITAIKLGAYDYISKPYRMAEIDVMVRRAWEKRELTRANTLLRARVRATMPAELPASQTQLHDVMERVNAIAPTDTPIVIHGESGTGKTYLARYIHSISGRPADLYAEVTAHDAHAAGGILGYLFGHEPGSGRHVTSRKNGVLQLAERGTVMIDLHALDAHARSVLFRAIEQGSFTRVGGTQRFPLRVRMILCDRAPESANGNAAYTFPAEHITLSAVSEDRVNELTRLVDLERKHIEAALVRANWHQGRAAESLGISSKTMYRKMREYALVRPRKRKLARRPTDPTATSASTRAKVPQASETPAQS